MRTIGPDARRGSIIIIMSATIDRTMPSAIVQEFRQMNDSIRQMHDKVELMTSTLLLRLMTSLLEVSSRVCRSDKSSR